ncbi:MAG: DUF3035 domain-containing protein [Geminicoccaceae bacterium]|nr:DUF3035 domain-containing protein [Geminicoccaceae bacterium]
MMRAAMTSLQGPLARIRRFGLACASTLALIALAACSGTVQEKLGINQRAPDEFQVIRRAPLELPPDYHLRPPGQVEGTSKTTPAEAARAIVTGSREPLPETATPGEQALLDATRVQADPDIRTKLLEENTELTQVDESQFLFMLNWQRENMAYADAVIDPDKEAARLLDEKAASRVTTRRVSREAVNNGGGGQE